MNGGAGRRVSLRLCLAIAFAVTLVIAIAVTIIPWSVMTSADAEQSSRTDGAQIETVRQEPPADPPETGFEQRGGHGTTTNTEESEFLRDVARASPRVRSTVLGQSLQGRPLRLLRIGFPRPPADQEIADGPSVLVVGGQHGNEPAGREMSLQLVRDLAFTDDAALLEQLTGTTVLVMPNTNPDGLEANQRGNAARIDTNRDHLNVRTPESRAIARVLREFSPDIGLDAHEAGNPLDRHGQVPRLRIGWQRNLNTDPRIYDLTREMVDDYVFPGVAAAGFPDTGHYGLPDDGQHSPAILSQTFGLRHGVGMLIETFGGTAASRVDLQLQTVHEVLRFQRERGGAVANASATAASRAAALGAARSEPYFLRGADWDTRRPPEEFVLDPPPCGYLLTAAQAERIQRHVELFPLETERIDADRVFVTMGQPLMTLVPELLDPRGRRNEVDARALEDCSKPGSADRL
ncbi:succinylglutamate desuccinylase/aspartoacylase family protein [Haloechinothrix sp. YIM 98757]|uniref:Succinylglutamate desuccinylase/aspartoacylase family protein n=1 Tax=Haloechinothrix aidingensis TaxID=2752311 RepID=A0A838A9Y7_9PSEU|nr:M14 family metallocarboxypeptidase [Haloechinothrix aidingensis]MBA0126127.1 succinylglutamate desuccinylase/aspartoacylase family protein [Haloechinothrix aidingensis]